MFSNFHFGTSLDGSYVRAEHMICVHFGVSMQDGEDCNPRAELEAVAVAEDKMEALSSLARDEVKMAAIGRWYTEDSVGFSGVLAQVNQSKPKLPVSVIKRFQMNVESQALGLGRKAAGMESVSLKSLLPHAQEDLQVPAGYTLDALGVYQVDRRRGRILICHYPLVLEGYVRDPETDVAMVVIAWRAGGEWRRMAISRETMGLAGDLARVSGQFGAPIHSSNAGAVVAYFSAFESLNLPKFEECKGITRMGWTPEMDAFLVGETLISTHGVERIQGPATLQDGWSKAGKIFLPAGQDILRIMSGYHKRGTMEGWQEALGLAEKHPFALAGIYLSLLPPLMQIIGSDNLVFEWSGRSSVGKTTALALAASVWGQPRLNLDPSIVSSWRITDVYLERLLATLGDLPFFLDDTRTANPFKKNGLDPVQAVYDVTAGTTKGRGTLTGTEAKRGWRTVLLSTGEDPITGDSKKGGVYARSWAVGAWPWGETTPATAAKVLRLESVIGENYGHLGPLWVEAILTKRHVWDKWRDLYRGLRDSYGTKGVMGDGGGVVGRLGKNLAAIEMVANVARTILPEIFGQVSFQDCISELWRWAQAEGCGADVYQEAAITLRNHVAANQYHFWPRGKEAPAVGGWWGMWPLPSEKSLFPNIYIRPDIVMQQIKMLGHTRPMDVVLEWEKRGIIKAGHNRTKKGSAALWTRQKIKCDGTTMLLIEFTPPAESVEDLDHYDQLVESVEEAG
jgi:putative DNA primase/helicase